MRKMAVFLGRAEHVVDGHRFIIIRIFFGPESVFGPGYFPAQTVNAVFPAYKINIEIVFVMLPVSFGPDYFFVLYSDRSSPASVRNMPTPVIQVNGS